MRGRVLKPGRNCRSITGVGRSGLLIDGADYYTAFYMAALKARNYVLISGWQFDSEVRLLRDGMAGADKRVRFLDFLNMLCERNRELKVHILAWDFSLIFMLEREWIQEWVFNWQSNDRISFRFDSRHALGASQHQKFVVIDGCTAFIGGMDICSGRWDDRSHMPVNPERNDGDGRSYEPYHDIQCYATGDTALELASIFKERWLNSTGEELKLKEPVECDYIPEGIGLPISANKAALSITQGQMLTPVTEPVEEIKALYADAIMSARRLVYMENQYLSARSVHETLLKRMAEPGLPPIEVVIILPMHPHGFLEEIAVGTTQARILTSLKEAASRGGHAFGAYYPSAGKGAKGETGVYVHSKVFIVDDRMLSAGSANTTNRSIGLDTELNITWEAVQAERGYLRLVQSIKEIRVNLLAEHTGVDNDYECALLARTRGLVKYLDSIAEKRRLRLRRHPMSSYIPEYGILKRLNGFILDPERPVIEGSIYELLSPVRESAFLDGITLLRKWITNG